MEPVPDLAERPEPHDSEPHDSEPHDSEPHDSEPHDSEPHDSERAGDEVSATEVSSAPALAGVETCYAPEVAFDQNGVLYYLFVGLAGKGNSPVGVFLTTSADRGKTFSQPSQVLGAERYQARLAIDGTIGQHGRLHLVWLEASSDAPTGGLPPGRNPILTAFSDDGGKTFSSPTQVNDPARTRAVAPAIALGPDHKVHVLYYDLQDDARDYQGLEGTVWEGRWSLVVASSADGGATFGSGVVVDDQLVPPGRVMLVFTMPPASLVANEDGALVAAWHDARHGDWDVFTSRSSDHGTTWTEPRRLNDDPMGNGRHQYLPRIAVSGTRVDAIFYDRRDDGQNLRNHTYFAYSEDNGANFAPNVRITRNAWDTRSGQDYLVPSAKGLTESGSRIALLSSASSALAAWTDARNSRAAPYQDIYATEVVGLPRSSNATATWVVVAIAIAGAGSIAVFIRHRRSAGAFRRRGAVPATVSSGQKPACQK